MPHVRFVPHAEPLDSRVVPSATPAWPTQIGQAVGADDGGPPVVHLLDSWGNGDTEFVAYDATFRGGVRTALGDVTGDGVADVVTAAGPGGGPHVKVFDGKTGREWRNFFAYHVGFTGGVEVAVGDVNRDGYGDVITGAGAGGGPHVKVFDGRTGAELFSYFAFAPTFTGGVYVASGDVNRDGYADIITGAGAGGSPHVRVLDGKTGADLTNFFAFEPAFRGGARVASGDLNADGVDDLIVAAGPGGGPHVKAFNPRTGELLFNRFVADADFRGGVRLAVVNNYPRERDGIVARTRTDDVVTSRNFDAGDSNALDLPSTTWVGDGEPPTDLPRSILVPGMIVGDIAPFRTVEGQVTAIADDRKSMTVRRGDGTPLTVYLIDESVPPPPPGSYYIDGGPLPPAVIGLGDQTVGVDQLHVGRWVRVRAGRASDPAATDFTALRVQLL